MGRLSFRYTEGVILSGSGDPLETMTGRTSGETVKAPKGQSYILRKISQAKGQSEKTAVSRGELCSFAPFYIL